MTVHDNPEVSRRRYTSKNNYLLTLAAQFLPEVWTLYGIAVVVFALRFFVRIRTLGIGGLCGDDYFAVLSVFFLTIDGIVVDRACMCSPEYPVFSLMILPCVRLIFHGL